MLLKKLQEEREAHPERMLFYFDEARFGLKGVTGAGWFRKKVTPIVSQKTSYENFYAYSAVDAHSGDHFTLLLPGVDTELMNTYLAELSKNYKNKKILLIMDQAGWHRSKTLKIPENIYILHLPPYSPELNPVELLWRYLKRHVLRNRFHASLAALMDELSDFVANMSLAVIKNICNGYLGIY